jgi:uroporphyrinogen-III synthase
VIIKNRGKLKVNKILVSQPRPAVIEKSPFYEFSQKNELSIDYKPLIRVDGVTLKEFRAQRSEILDHTTMIFSSRTTIDSFFRICEEARITVPETMKYICNTEAVALYLQKYIVYRKRKISFADGTFNSLLELIVKHKDEKFMLALTEPFKPELPDALAKLKLKVSPVVFARTVAADLKDVNPADYDIIALYSPNDVKALAESFDIEKLPVVATFGEATLRAAKEAGLKVKASAPSPEAPSMVKALDIYCSKVAEGAVIEDAEVHSDTEKEEFIRAQQSKLQKKTRTRTTKKNA